MKLVQTFYSINTHEKCTFYSSSTKWPNYNIKWWTSFPAQLVLMKCTNICSFIITKFLCMAIGNLFFLQSMSKILALLTPLKPRQLGFSDMILEGNDICQNCNIHYSLYWFELMRICSLVINIKGLELNYLYIISCRNGITLFVRMI